MSLPASRSVRMTALPLVFVLGAFAVTETPAQCGSFAHILDALLAAAEVMFVVGFLAALGGSQEPPKRRSSKLGGGSLESRVSFGKPQDRKPEKYGLVLLGVSVVLAVAVVALKQGSVSRNCLDGLMGFV